MKIKIFLLMVLTIFVSSISFGAGYGGGIGTEGYPYQIWTAAQLNAIGVNPGDWNKCFRLMTDIDMAGVQYNIIGNSTTGFAGKFDGNNHVIRNLKYVSSANNYIGLFACTAYYAQIKNLGLENINISSAGISVGGLIGRNGGKVYRCYSAGIVSGNEDVGGLIGENAGMVSESYSTAKVSGTGYYIGGLIGWNDNAVSNSYSTGAVIGNGNYIGGLMGWNDSTVRNCYSTSIVSGNGTFVGGLIGGSGNAVSNCYSTGTVGGINNVGGLIGWNGSYVFNCYSVGTVGGTGKYIGGLIGWNDIDYVAGCFWDIQTSKLANGFGGGYSKGVTGKTTSQMMTCTVFISAGWDFTDETANGTEDIWQTPVDGKSYPKLFWQIAPMAAAASITPNCNKYNGTYVGLALITLSCPTPDVTIRYTTNGSDPTPNSKVYTSPFTVNNSCVVKAAAFKKGYVDSDVALSDDLKITSRLAVKDVNGVPFTVSLTGGGYGQVIGDANDQIVIKNTSEKSILTITTPYGRIASIKNITVNGSLNGIMARTTDLHGNVTVAGSLGILTLNNAVGGQIKIAAASNSKTELMMTVNRAKDMSVDSKIPINSISAIEWIGGSFNIPSLRFVSIRGDMRKRNIAGDFDVDITAGGTIDYVNIAGSLSGRWTCKSIKTITTLDMEQAELTLTQSPDSFGRIFALGMLTVKGYFYQSKILSNGNIGMVSIGVIEDSTCFAGNILTKDLNKDGVLDLPNPAIDINYSQPAVINSISIMGIKGEYYGVVNANIAAAKILNVYMAYPKYNNGNRGFFGITADSVKLLTVKDNKKISSWYNLDKPGIFTSASSGNFKISLN